MVLRFSKTAALLLAFACLCAAACSVYFKTEAKREVDKLNPDLPRLLRAKVENDPQIKEQARGGYEAHLKQFGKKDSILKAIYEGKGPESFRFVKDHAATPNHAKLLELLASSYDDGLNPQFFGIDQLSGQPASITQNQTNLDHIQVSNLNEEQKARLLAELIEAEKNGKAPDLHGSSLLDWLLMPERQSEYSDLHAAWEQLKAARLKRDEAENATELFDAAVWFKYLRAMELKEDLLRPTWDASLKDFSETSKAAIPNNPHYLRLKAELARYRNLEAKKEPLPKIVVGAKAKIKKGATGTLIKEIQQVLSVQGFYSGPVNGAFDDVTEAALIEFQRAHQVVDDGVIGLGTGEAMNVGFSERVREIRLAMDRQRRSPTRYEKFYFRVNIPEFIVEVVEDGKIVRRHKVVVGNLLEINHTPEFTAKIKKVIYNPSWYITKRIFEKEEIPEWEKDPGYFDKKGYIVKYNKDGEPISAYEPPGYGNALGRVKIIFPNPNDVYLHDTPKKFLFNRTIRPFSHGCIRLQNPLDMAEYILKKDNNPAVNDIEKFLATTATHEIDLTTPIPIFIEYNTVSTTDDGRAVFLKDIYKKDEEALATLDNAL